MPLPPFDANNPDHVRRQIVLATSFRQRRADNPLQLPRESNQTLLDVLSTYAAELAARLENPESRPLDIRRASDKALALITHMVQEQPGLADYDTATAPSNLAEVTMNFLAHAVALFSEQSFS